jgi:hypothetical protein
MMKALLIPTLLSFLVLAAHFFRGGHVVLAVVSCAVPSLLLLRRAWATRIVQVLLVAGALEWVRTTLQIRAVRIDQGREWTRMAVILGSVAGFTLLSSLVYCLPPLRRHYCRRSVPSSSAPAPLESEPAV